MNTKIASRNGGICTETEITSQEVSLQVGKEAVKVETLREIRESCTKSEMILVETRTT